MATQKKETDTPTPKLGDEEGTCLGTFSKVLLQWYGRHKRDLPWRGEKDPYRIWVSEIILQQTQVSQGWQYYRRFIETLPDVKSLAAASEDEVLKLWEGLGYYSRARHLHEAAGQIMHSGGRFPTTYEGVHALKGVGSYTAAAICSMAYNMPTAAIDGNAYRVFTRCFGIEEPIDRTSGQHEVEKLAGALISKQQPGQFNQAIMDLGATICTPHAPDCKACPLLPLCVAHREGRAEDYPVKTSHIKHTVRHLIYVMVWKGNSLLIHRRNRRDIWRGLYEPLLIESDSGADPDLSPGSILHDLSIQAEKALTLLQKGVKHVLTHRTLYIDFYELHLVADATLPKPLTNDGYRWVDRRDLTQYAFPAVFQKTDVGLP